MHKGKVYRRVLPPAMSPNMLGQAPFGMKLTGLFEYRIPGVYVSAFKVHNSDVSIDLPLGRVAWRGSWNVGPDQFGFGFEQLLSQTVPYVKWTLVVFDNFGGTATTTWWNPLLNSSWPAGLEFHGQYPYVQAFTLPFIGQAPILIEPTKYFEEP